MELLLRTVPNHRRNHWRCSAKELFSKFWQKFQKTAANELLHSYFQESYYQRSPRNGYSRKLQYRFKRLTLPWISSSDTFGSDQCFTIFLNRNECQINMERRNQICYSSEIKLKVKEHCNPLMSGGSERSYILK